MAGAEGPAPGTGEQRAEHAGYELVRVSREMVDRLISDESAPVVVVGLERLDDGTCDMLLRNPDPASALAALLAEQPDATVAALEALLTSDEAVEAAARQVNPAYDAATHDATRALWRQQQGWAIFAACRSLRPKAPKEDGDA